uniref:Large ribosomal subunit protein eL37 n=1 Tax=Felis catus TaxID=9685 RepID=A0ABI7X3F0_FELCA
MTKGTSSFGKCHNKTHTLCFCCDSKAHHLQKQACGKCGCPIQWKRKCNQSTKAKRRNILHCRFRSIDRGAWVAQSVKRLTSLRS